MRLVLLGPPGAGKGTHALVLSKQHTIAHISTGDMLREALRAGTAQGLKAKEYMDKGALVPDEVVIAIVRERLGKPDAKRGYILDGFPRTPAQAESLDAMLKELGMPLDLALYFKTSLSVIIRRLSGRRICSKCGKTYHLVNFKPKMQGICDVCGADLMQRADDREEVIKERLVAYEKQTAPLIDYYKKKKTLAEVDGDLEVDPLAEELEKLFAKKGLK
jgi:adenylate kinase